jgi:hypothetical protein
VNTDEFIRRIAGANAPVRRLHPPWMRALLWLAIACAYIAAVVALHPHAPGLTSSMFEPRLIVEWLAAFATGATAALAAFCSTIPGYDRRILWLPVAPGAVWAASLGAGCISDWLRFGAEGLAALATAGLGNTGLRLFHPGDATIMILVWHVGVAFALVALAGLLGKFVLSWRRARARAVH